MKDRLITMAKFSLVGFLALGVTLSSFARSHPSSAAAQNNTLSTTGDSIIPPSKKSQFQYVSQKLNEMQLPKSLAVIPVIESEYNCKAVSPKGAGGMWQLMPGTAKSYGISSSARFQTAPATMAALKYFKQLHKQFGNWEFAVAAYNAGEGRVQRALQKNPAATSVQQLALPKETKLYVQKYYRMQSQLQSYSA